jgi:hypothetical protein
MQSRGFCTIKASAMLAFSWLLLLSPTLLSARKFSAYACTDQYGNKVFQDRPCGLGSTALVRAEPGWSRVARLGNGCLVRSPLMQLGYGSGDTQIKLDGGASIILIGNESGIAANLIIEATWPIRAQSNDEFTNETATPESAQSRGSQAQGGYRVELSPDISRQGIFTANTGVLVVDSMSDATRLRFGFSQTGNVLRAMRSGQAFGVRLLTRNPTVLLNSSELSVSELTAATHSLMSCVRNR